MSINAFVLGDSKGTFEYFSLPSHILLLLLKNSMKSFVINFLSNSS